MKTVLGRLGLSLLIIMVGLGLVIAQDEQVGSSDKTETIEVSKQDFKPKLSFKSVLAPTRMEQLTLETEAFKGSLEVKEIAASGKSVKKDEVLLVLDTEPLDEQIKDTIRSVESQQQRRDHAEKELKLQQASSAEHLEKLRKKLNDVERNLKHYVEVEWPMQLEQADLSMQNSDFHVGFQRTELDQLKKMYEDSELAEDTQDTVIKRAKFSVKMSEANLKLTKQRDKLKREYHHPIKLKNMEDGVKWTRQEFARTEEQTKIKLSRTAKSLEDTIHNLGKSQKNLDELKADLKLCNLMAPADGIVVYGDLVQRLQQGRPAGVAAHQRTKPGDNVQAGQCVLTLYTPDAYQVNVKVTESNVRYVKPGLAVRILVPALAQPRLKGKVSAVSFLPEGNEGGANTYSILITLDATDENLDLRPGFKCFVDLETAPIVEALVVPIKVVSAKDGRHFCQVVQEGAEPVEREIVIGGSDDELYHVIDGLEAGEKVILKKD